MQWPVKAYRTLSSTFSLTRLPDTNILTLSCSESFMFFTLRRDPKGLRRDQHFFLLLLQDLAGSRRSLEKVKRQDGEKLQRQVKFLKACSFAIRLELRIFETERLDLKFIFLTPDSVSPFYNCRQPVTLF